MPSQCLLRGILC
jgi:hypothetical protein